MGTLIERKRRSRKVAVKMFWMERCEAAAGRSAYAYQTFCEIFSKATLMVGANRRLAHEQGAKESCDWVETCEVVVIISKTGCGKSFLGQDEDGRHLPPREVGPHTRARQAQVPRREHVGPLRYLGMTLPEGYPH